MNQQEFIAALRKELAARCPEENIDEIADDFRAHFEEAVRAGQSEEEISAMLGDVTEIAAQFADLPLPTAAADAMPPAASKNGAGLVIDVSHANVVCGMRDEGDAFFAQVRRGSHPIEDNSILITHTPGGLTVKSLPEKDFVERLFHIFDHRTVYVDIPRSFDGEVTIRLGSGNLKLLGLATPGAIRCDLKSGNILLEGVTTAGEIDVRATSGNVKLEGCKGDANIDCHSGNVKAIAHSGSVSARLVSGNLRIHTDRIGKDSLVSAKSGNVRLEIGELAADLSLECVSGNMRFEVGNLAGNITGHTKSGNITGILPRDTKAFFALQSAGARNAFPSAPPPRMDMPVVSLTSKSGNVSVKKR